MLLNIIHLNFSFVKSDIDIYPMGVYNKDGDFMNNQECCRHKKNGRSVESKKALENRINRITGQLGGIKRMIDEDRYCADILIQLSAAESALQNLSYIILKEHLESCVSEEIKNGNSEIIAETMDIIKKIK